MNRLAYWGHDYLVTSVGAGIDAHVNAIESYQSGLKEESDANGESYWAGRIDWSAIPQIPGATPLENLMIEVGGKVLRAAKVEANSPRLGLILSTTKGNIDLLQSQADFDERVLPGVLAQRVAASLGITTTPQVVCNACISGLLTIILGSRLIASGTYDRVLVIGADLMSPFVISGFRAFKSVSSHICKPFDASRDGLSMGEACGAVLLTADPFECDAIPVAVKGGAVSNDANHISGPSRTGDGLYLAIREALDEAQVPADEVDFVGLHGTATVYNDEMESKAIALAGLSDKPVNSLKPYFGHTLGACGVIESILSVWQLRHKRLWATMEFESLGTPQPLLVSAWHHNLSKSSVCVKAASGFGGCNAAVVFATDCTQGSELQWTSGKVRVESSVRLQCPENEDFDQWIREQYKSLGESNMKFFKMDRLCKLGYVAVAKLLAGRSLPEDRYRVAVVLSNRCSSLDTDMRHQALLDAGQPASPAVFVYTLANIVSGEICIRHQIKGEGWFLIESADENVSKELASRLLQEHRADFVLTGRCEMFGKKAFTCIDLLSLQAN